LPQQRKSRAITARKEDALQTPAAFEYERATSVEHALSLLQSLGPEARIVAGGHSLLPMMKLRLARPDHLIDINDLKELAYIRQEGGEVLIGALTRHRELLESELLAPEEVAVAIAAEIIAARYGKQAPSLSQGSGPIHWQQALAPAR
jgi:aerobic carbon-monoxide dehydrogenase medium subunit